MLHANGGVITTTQKGHVAGHGDVWCNPNAIANVIGLKNAKQKHFSVACDDEADTFAMTNKLNSRVMVFRQHPGGLHIADPRKGSALVNTNAMNAVQKNKEGYTDRQFERALVARNLWKQRLQRFVC